MTRRKKICLCLLVISLVWGWWYDGWAGTMTAAFLMLIFFNFVRPGYVPEHVQQERQRERQQDYTLQLGELVPAKRGNPDPTRPDEEMAGLITANWDRIERKF